MLAVAVTEAGTPGALPDPGADPTAPSTPGAIARAVEPRGETSVVHQQELTAGAHGYARSARSAVT
jgi:hypothetical protein